MNTQPLPPCQTCGGEGELRKRAGLWHVVCLECGRRTPGFREKENAEALWSFEAKKEMK